MPILLKPASQNPPSPCPFSLYPAVYKRQRQHDSFTHIHATQKANRQCNEMAVRTDATQRGGAERIRSPGRGRDDDGVRVSRRERGDGAVVARGREDGVFDGRAGGSGGYWGWERWGEGDAEGLVGWGAAAQRGHVRGMGCVSWGGGADAGSGGGVGVAARRLGAGVPGGAHGRARVERGECAAAGTGGRGVEGCEGAGGAERSDRADDAGPVGADPGRDGRCESRDIGDVAARSRVRGADGRGGRDAAGVRRLDGAGQCYGLGGGVGAGLADLLGRTVGDSERVHDGVQLAREVDDGGREAESV
nr:hypothetical protein CFP56_24391 [Quercus suber]